MKQFWSVIVPICLTLAPAQAATPAKLDEYSVNSLEVSLNTSGGLTGTKECVGKLGQVLRGAGITVQKAQTLGDAGQSLGILLGHHQSRLIVSGTCLSGGKHAVISIVNPFENKSAADLTKKIRAQF